MRTSNPFLQTKTYQLDVDATATMTARGAASKTLLLLAIAMGVAGFVWHQYFLVGDVLRLNQYLMIGSIGGLICALVTAFVPRYASITGPLYAAFEGCFLGGISAFFEKMYPGLPIQAVALTLGTLTTMLLVYRLGIVKVNQRLRLGIVSATGGIALLYFFSMIASFFGMPFSLLHGTSLLSIGFSFLVVGVAAFNLLLDFDFIEQAERFNAPKYMEWYSAFALMVTLIWLYIEIIHLLAKLRDRNR